MKGIVISVPLHGSKEAGLHLESEFDAQLMRGWLLFWDRLDWPTANIPLKVSDPALEAALGEAGVLQRTRVEVTRRLIDHEVLVEPHLQAFRDIRGGSGDWALAMGDRTFSVPESIYAEGAGIEVRITQALPVPSTDVPWNDIIAFRAKRKPELDALRDAIDEIKEDFLDDPRRPLAEAAAVRRFVKRAHDHVNATRDAGFSTRLFDMAARFNVAAFASAAAALPAVAFGGSFPEIVGNGLVAGGALALSDVAGMLSAGPSKSPFAYLLRYHDELFPPD